MLRFTLKLLCTFVLLLTVVPVVGILFVPLLVPLIVFRLLLR